MTITRTFLITSLVALTACSSPSGGPDKTLAGAVLGAGWGAGAGAIVGNQVGNPGAGAAVGAGVGTVGGALTGMGFDIQESTQVEHEQQLASLKIQNLSNQKQLRSIQETLDNALVSNALGGVFQVFFDTDETSLKAGSIANLETIAESIKASPAAFVINVVGHSDDSGTPTYNASLAEARARTVTAYLASRGISMDQIKVKSFGSERPIAANTTPVGRQLNRRVDIYISR